MTREKYMAEADRLRWTLNAPAFLTRLGFAALAPLMNPFGQMVENWRRAK